MEITLIHPSEEQALKTALALVRDVFWEFEAPEYEDEGVFEFDSFIEYGSIHRQMEENRMLIWGAYNSKGALLGVLGAQPPCHISLLFVDKRVHRRGVGRALMATMADYFRAGGGGEALTVNASPFAVPVYGRLGFVPASGEQVVNGIRFTPMCCPLENAPSLN